MRGRQSGDNYLTVLAEQVGRLCWLPEVRPASYPG